MKKILKIIAILIGVVVLAGASFAAWVYFRGIPSYPTAPPDLTVKPDSAMVAEGKHLATLVCKNCHLSANGMMEGKFMDDMPKEFGKVWSMNITHDTKYGAGRYTDGELAFLLRTGIKRDGVFAPPWMPKFPHLSDYDLQSIIAYLRSDAPELAPSQKQQPPAQPTFLAKFLCVVAFKPLPFPTQPIEAPPMSDKVAFGKYISTGKVECFSCHSPSFETMNIMEPEKTPGYFSGGNAMTDEDGKVILTRNLTPDKETGIGNWTEEQFIKAVKYGQRDGKPALRKPMVPFTAMTDEEASAIFAYLKSLPAIRHNIDSLYSAK
jgi:mono/diheme cytochrome c family protein